MKPAIVEVSADVYGFNRLYGGPALPAPTLEQEWLVDGVTTLAKDWLHTNSIAYSPADGNLLISMRHQDWVLKLDYRDGAAPPHWLTP